jgi:hypothetical protein
MKLNIIFSVVHDVRCIELPTMDTIFEVTGKGKCHKTMSKVSKCSFHELCDNIQTYLHPMNPDIA